MAANNAKHWLTAKAMADACGLDFRTFKKLDVEPVKKGGKGQSHWYAFSDVMRAWHSYQLSQHVVGGEDEEHGTINIKTEMALKTRADRIGQEIKNNVLLGEYVPIEEVEGILSGIAATMDGVLTTIVLNIKRAHPDVPAAVLAVIEKQVISSQNKLADIRPDFSE